MKHQLAGVLTDRHRQVIHAVVEEYTSRPLEKSVAMDLMPIVDVPAAVLEHEIVSGSGGKTQERQLNAEGKSIVGHSSESVLYKPGSYQEFIPFFEKDLLQLRKHGTIGDRGLTGLTGGELDFVSRAADKLRLRLGNRAHQLVWDAIFNDQFVYQGTIKTFGRPAQNTITAPSDWSAPASDPFKDLITILKTNPVLIKYQAVIEGLIVNPKTEADVMKRALEAGYVTNANIASAGVNEVMNFAAPGLPPFISVADAIQEETFDAITQKVVLGNAQYLVPDDKVLVMMNFGNGVLFPEYGQLQITENQNDPSATIASPAVGMYTFLDEEGLRNRKSPRIEVVSGFNGGPNLMRPFDVIILNV